MKKIFILIATLATVNSFAQKECSTEDVDSATMTKLPWFAKNTQLNNFIKHDTIKVLNLKHSEPFVF